MPRTYKPKVALYRGAFCADISLSNARRKRLPLGTTNRAIAEKLVGQLAAAAPSYECSTSVAAHPLVRDILKKRVDFARSRAATRGVEHTITLSDVIALYDAQAGACAITGIPFDVSERLKTEDAWKRPYAPSIDRIDSCLGYTAENVRLVCSAVNNAMGSWGEAILIHVAYALVAKRNGTAGD